MVETVAQLGGIGAEHLWVAGGTALTLALGLALLYWIDQEWRTLDEPRRRDAGSLVKPAGDEPGAPPRGDPPASA